MAMTAENVVKDVEVRIVKKGTPEERQVYDVVDIKDVKWVAWEKDLAERAWNLKGQPAVWSVDVSQNGQYTNRTLKDIQPAVTNGMTDALGNALGQATNTFPSVTSNAGFDPQPSQKSNSERESIHRQVAGKVAAVISNNPLEFWANVQDLTAYFDTGKVPGGNNSPGFTSEPVQVTQDDDLPF